MFAAHGSLEFLTFPSKVPQPPGCEAKATVMARSRSRYRVLQCPWSLLPSALGLCVALAPPALTVPFSPLTYGSF